MGKEKPEMPSKIKELEYACNQVKISDVGTIPLPSDGNTDNLLHPEASIIKEELVEFRFIGEFVIGGVRHRMVLDPSVLHGFRGDVPKFESKAFHQKARFTHHIFELDDEVVGAAMRRVYNSFYEAVRGWKNNNLTDSEK